MEGNMRTSLIRKSSAAMVGLLAAQLLGSGGALAHEFPGDADSHGHISGVVQNIGRCGTLLSGAEGTGFQTDPASYAYTMPDPTPATAGNAVDHRWVHDTDEDPLVFDMGVGRNRVLLFPSIDHLPIPAEALESTVYGSNAAAGPWTQGNIVQVFNGGFDAAWISDDYVSLWTFGAAYRYVAVGHGGPGAELADGDAEIDAVCATTDIQPREVNEVIFPGGSVDITKTVTTQKRHWKGRRPENLLRPQGRTILEVPHDRAS